MNDGIVISKILSEETRSIHSLAVLLPNRTIESSHMFDAAMCSQACKVLTQQRRLALPGTLWHFPLPG